MTKKLLKFVRAVIVIWLGFANSSYAARLRHPQVRIQSQGIKGYSVNKNPQSNQIVELSNNDIVLTFCRRDPRMLYCIGVVKMNKKLQSLRGGAEWFEVTYVLLLITMGIVFVQSFNYAFQNIRYLEREIERANSISQLNEQVSRINGFDSDVKCFTRLE